MIGSYGEGGAINSRRDFDSSRVQPQCNLSPDWLRFPDLLQATDYRRNAQNQGGGRLRFVDQLVAIVIPHLLGKKGNRKSCPTNDNWS
ncbi:hypothetical protein PoB_000243700 [Plakobranchus ocellatus]|uniref:Uncharacterized protein n=1 Tax=Plakobranchus ocellatus TaxID=259542 RepID=A0AAV3XZK1_9GAST|nr:hypothetical protein PoB_000243700 [Plakobranchus ocellatus]